MCHIDIICITDIFLLRRLQSILPLNKTLTNLLKKRQNNHDFKNATQHFHDVLRVRTNVLT